MKILHINTFDTGGAAIAAIRLHKALLSYGIESYMLFAKKRRDDIPNAVEFKPPIKTKFNSILYRIQRKLGYKKNYWEISHQKLAGRVEGFESFSFSFSDYDITTQEIYKQADIINLHWISGFLDYKFFRLNTKPVVWTLHDMNPFTGGCHYSHNCYSFRSNCLKCPQLAGTKDINLSAKILKRKHKYLKENTITLVALNQWMKKNTQSSVLFDNYDVTIIPNSLDQNIFKPLSQKWARKIFNLPVDKTILLFNSEKVTNFRKGFDLLYDCVNKLNSDFHFCAVGSMEELPKCDNITFINKISDERLMAILYNSIDGVIIPSREDNLPNVILESLSCGKPVLTFPVGGIPDHIVHGKTGLLAKEISAVDLQNIIIEFLQIKDKFNKDYIRNYALKSFSPEIQSQKYAELYKKKLKI
ncbi:MAG: glycosyltransferase [bacterium]